MDNNAVFHLGCKAVLEVLLQYAELILRKLPDTRELPGGLIPYVPVIIRVIPVIHALYMGNQRFHQQIV